MNLKETILEAARADIVPASDAGLWFIKKWAISKPLFVQRNKDGTGVTIPIGHYTNLHRYTDATLHLQGELVMHDCPDELKKHLNFMLRARGRVLITGLGLGCVVRGCLANPSVESITVIERDKDVLKLVAPYMPLGDRLRIIKADAIEWTKANEEEFDCAWHDIWNDPDKGEPHLAVLHMELLMYTEDKTKFQGAWAFPRDYKRVMNLV